MMRRAVVLLGLLVAACASDPPPPDRYFRLQATKPATAGEWTQRIVVHPCEAHGVFSERSLLFRREAGSGAIEQYNYHFWAEAPAVMLGDVVTDHLRARFGERQVYRAAARARPDIVVRPRLRNLVHVLEPQPQAQLAIQFAVTDDVNTPLLVVDYERSEQLRDDSPAAFAEAINRLADEAAGQLAERLATLR